MTPSLSAPHSTFLVLTWLVPGCGGVKLDLGRDKPPSDIVQDPDAAVDETLPQVIAAHQVGAHAIATDDTRVYWSTCNGNPNNVVRSCAFDRCSTTTVTYTSSLGGCAATVAVGGANVYWNDLQGIVTCSIAGCPSGIPMALVTVDDLVSFVVDQTHVYWTTREGTIRRCLLPGCFTHELVATVDGSGAMVDAGAELFVLVLLDASPKGNIVAVAKDGSVPPRVVAASQHMPRSIAVDADRVYWTNSYAAGTLSSCLRSGCNGEPTVVAGAQRDPTNVVIDEKNAYFIRPQDPSHLADIVECPLAGCGAAPKILARDQRTPGPGLALDSTHVYWTDGDRLELVLATENEDGDVSRARK